ncbi:hypothetical protein XGA_0293 [Xanthomonas hortorum ATCC 19865]|nr:hypothetical protein XGA_0293 [Xanthomonas hortorum ATCC 19865]
MREIVLMDGCMHWIYLHGRNYIESSLFETKAKAAGAGEEVDS